MANLGHWFPPWTMTRAVWHKALKPIVSGVSTDVMLFSEHGSPLIYHYQVLGRSEAHTSLRGTFVTKLRVFTVRADDEAKWEAGRAPNSTTRLLPSSDSLTSLPRSIRPRGSDVDSPACKARRAGSTRTMSSTIATDVSSDLQVVVESPSHYEAPAVPVNISVLVESVCSCLRYLPYHQCSCHPTGCVRIMYMTPWTCFRYSKYLRKLTVTYLLRHR